MGEEVTVGDVADVDHGRAPFIVEDALQVASLVVHFTYHTLHFTIYIGEVFMDVMQVLTSEKKVLLAQISSAANKGETNHLISMSQKLERVEMLISRYQGLVHDVELLRQGDVDSGRNAEMSRTRKKNASRTSNSNRERGREIRKNFLLKLEKKGIEWQLVKGETIYNTRSGERIGVAVATERQPDKWFLGLPDGGFEHAVLLCKRDSGEVVEIFLHKDFFDKYGENMSRSKGQVKFNIAKRGNVYTVQVPEKGSINPNEFFNGSSFL